MKLIQMITAGLLVLLLLTACAPEKEPPAVTTEQTTATTVETTVTTAPVTMGTDDPVVAPVGGIGEKSEHYDVIKEDKTVLSVRLSLPVASISGDDALQETLTARLDQLEQEIRSYAQSLQEKYEADITEGKEGLATPSLQVRFALNYFTSEAASLTYLYNETTAEGTTLSYARFYNIDLRVGSEIRLSALLNEGTEELLAAKLKEAVEQSGAKGLYAGQKDLISDLLDDRWYLTRNALAFRFSAGDLAPVSSGEITVALDKAALDGMLSSYGSALIEEAQTSQTPTKPTENE